MGVSERRDSLETRAARSDPDENGDNDTGRLRRALALARFYIERFADPQSFVWTNPDKPPHEFARDAAREMDGAAGANRPKEIRVERNLAAGTGRMERLAGRRAGFVEFHQELARQALDAGEIGAARAALRVLRTTDFTASETDAEGLLAVLRDNRSTPDEIAEAARRLTRLAATPLSDRAG